MEFLSDAEVALIAVRLDGLNYAASQLINKQWARVTRDLQTRKERFMREWEVMEVYGTPKNPSFLEMATLKNFVRRHVLQKNDSLAKLAVQYSCSVMDLKVLNNLTSEHALMSRDEIFIQVKSKDEIRGQLGQVYYSTEGKREYVVVYPPGHVFEETEGIPSEVSRQWIASDSHGAERVRKQLIHLLCRSLKIDPLVAEAYLAVSDWNPVQAIRQYKLDDHWQDTKRP